MGPGHKKGLINGDHFDHQEALEPLLQQESCQHCTNGFLLWFPHGRKSSPLKGLVMPGAQGDPDVHTQTVHRASTEAKKQGSPSPELRASDGKVDISGALGVLTQCRHLSQGALRLMLQSLGVLSKVLACV